jgi:hypothetical protein
MERLHDLADRYPAISAIEGIRHLAGIYFHEVITAKRFAQQLNARGIDISVQTYKEGCPPSALTKLPLTMGYEAVDFLIDTMENVGCDLSHRDK